MATAEQPAPTGSGPLIERRYYVDILHPSRSLAEVMGYVKCHVEEFAPDTLAEFEKVKGAADGLEVGHEYHIKILGPWNGGVRVCAVGDDFFEFVTLDGHPEAGRIRFGMQPLPTEQAGFRFEIRSWARSRDGLVALAYSTLGLGKRVQEEAWVQFCQRVANYAGGDPVGEAAASVRVETVEYADGSLNADVHRRD